MTTEGLRDEQVLGHGICRHHGSPIKTTLQSCPTLAPQPSEDSRQPGAGRPCVCQIDDLPLVELPAEGVEWVKIAVR